MARRLAAQNSSRIVIYAAIVGNILVAATKFFAAIWTGSSAMFSEAVHSTVDTGNSLLLLYGMHKARAPADEDHPLGYGREIYFWSFVVAVMVMALGAGVSLFEGINHVLAPEPFVDVKVSYIVLGLSLVFEGTSWWIALRHFKQGRSYDVLLQAVRESKDPPSFMVLFEDSAAVIGILIALAGTYLSSTFAMPVIDGVASIMIGLVLALTAGLLAWETKGLLIGEPANDAIVQSIMRIAGETEGVARANGIITVHLSPDQLVVALSLEFSDELRTPEIEKKVVELEQRLRQAHAEVKTLFVKPQSAAVAQHAAAAGFAHTWLAE